MCTLHKRYFKRNITHILVEHNIVVACKLSLINRCSKLDTPNRGVGTKPGLWTLDWTMDWTMDWIMDSILELILDWTALCTNLVFWNFPGLPTIQVLTASIQVCAKGYDYTDFYAFFQRIWQRLRPSQCIGR